MVEMSGHSPPVLLELISIVIVMKVMCVIGFYIRCFLFFVTSNNKIRQDVLYSFSKGEILKNALNVHNNLVLNLSMYPLNL